MHCSERNGREWSLNQADIYYRFGVTPSELKSLLLLLLLNLLLLNLLLLLMKPDEKCCFRNTQYLGTHKRYGKKIY